MSFHKEEKKELDPLEVQRYCLTQLDAWDSKLRGVFSWPMDTISNQSFGYNIHCLIVEAWNKENRVTPIVEFHRKWLSDTRNIKLAIYAKDIDNYPGV